MKYVNLNQARSLLTDRRSRKWLWLAIAALLLGLFVLMTATVFDISDGPPRVMATLDTDTLHLLSGLRNPLLNASAIEFTALGSGIVLTVVVSLLSLYLILIQQHLMALHLLIVSWGATNLTSFMKAYFGRARPNELESLVAVQGYSYPSGHSLSAAAIYITIAYISCRFMTGYLRKTFMVTSMLLLILLIGFSRIYLGVHYLSDVLSGTLIGVAWAAFLCSIESHLTHKRLTSSGIQE